MLAFREADHLHSFRHPCFSLSPIFD